MVSSTRTPLDRESKYGYDSHASKKKSPSGRARIEGPLFHHSDRFPMALMLRTSHHVDI